MKYYKSKAKAFKEMLKEQKKGYDKYIYDKSVGFPVRIYYKFHGDEIEGWSCEGGFAPAGWEEDEGGYIDDNVLEIYKNAFNDDYILPENILLKLGENHD